MTQQHTSMATVGLQFLLAYFAATVRHQPSMIGRIHLFRAKACVRSWNVRRMVIVPAFRAIPFQHLVTFARHELAIVTIVTDLGALLLPLLGRTVVGPTLNARQMKEIITKIA